MKFIRISLIILISAFAILSCATRGAPGGGPVDRIPPEIIQTIPTTDSVNISPFLDNIVIYFSERMEESSVNQSIFISPNLKYSFNWRSGDELYIMIDDTLMTDQTYVFTIGSGASDERQNRMKQSNSIAFSTGAKLDRGWAAGKVYGLQRNETITLFAYMLNDTIDPDPRGEEPIYRSQTGKAGEFKLEYMKDGAYRVFAVQDQNSNFILDAVYEKVGIPFSDVMVDSVGPVPERLFFKLSLIDTTLPEIIGLRSIYDTHLQLRTSEPVIILPNTYLLKDSVTKNRINILGLSQNIENPGLVDLFTDSLRDGRVYTLALSSLTDSSGNEATPPLYYNFTHRAEADTNKTQLAEFLPADSVSDFHPNDEIFIEFSHPVCWQSVDTSFMIYTSGGDTSAGQWKAASGFDGTYRPQTYYIPDSSYNLKLDLSRVKDLWQRAVKDTILSRFMTIISARELGEMSGRIHYKGLPADTVIFKITQLGQGKQKFEKTQPISESFIFKMLPEGNYRISGFIDIDGNSRYSHGSLSPFQFAEPFSVSPDTLSVRKRWETTDVRLNMPNKVEPE